MAILLQLHYREVMREGMKLR